MNIKKKLKARNEGFSLIELMIVIVIIGALTAIILPQFDVAESDALDTGCDASNYGTLDQLSKYRSVNGVYPSRLHTGFEDVATTLPMGDTPAATDLADYTYANMEHAVTAATLTADQADSLKDAGIWQIAAGGFGISAVFTTVNTGVAVPSITDSWYEEFTDVDGDGFEDSITRGTDNREINSDEITINGVGLPNYAYPDPQSAQNVAGYTAAEDGIVVPLFVAPTSEWNEAVIDGVKTDSKIQIAQVGGCPWLEGGEQFRYYIAFFKVFNDGSKAKLIGTACPECGSLNP